MGVVAVVRGSRRVWVHRQQLRLSILLRVVLLLLHLGMLLSLLFVLGALDEYTKLLCIRQAGQTTRGKKLAKKNISTQFPGALELT